MYKKKVSSTKSLYADDTFFFFASDIFLYIPLFCPDLGIFSIFFDFGHIYPYIPLYIPHFFDFGHMPEKMGSKIEIL